MFFVNTIKITPTMIIAPPINNSVVGFSPKRNIAANKPVGGIPIVTMGIPPTGLLAAIFLLGEKPTTELFIGGLIIIIGVVMIIYNKTEKTNQS